MSLAETTVAQEKQLILAVDDNEQNLQLLEEYLWQWGYNVVVARDGAEALELFPVHNPELIVLDVMMPNVDGYEACAKIKGTPQGRRIPIVMLTALTSAEDKIRALDCGADDFLNKPIVKEELRTRIRSLLRIRNLRKELDSSENIILALTSALENRDPRSGGHVQRVAAYAAQLCEKLNMSIGDRETIVKGSLLHDLGMIGISDAIITKLTGLTDEETERWRAHTSMGASILSPLRTFQPFVPIVRWHHERIDGKGYPDGLKGDQIPLEARIVAIANRYDEVRHNEEALGDEAALARVREEGESGAFDLELLHIFEKTILDEPVTTPGRRLAIAKTLTAPRILAIDDSRANRELISATMAEAGFDVTQAETAKDGLEKIASQQIDVVILDLVMPDQDGLQVLEQIRRDPLCEFLPVIVLTAHRSTQLRQQAIVAGADDFLSYPVNRLELTTRVRSLLRIKDYHADLEQSQDVITALALTLEAKDVYTRGHSQRVGDLSYAFARHLEMRESAAQLIRTAGLLHDIGKIAVPEALLNKRGPLTREEFLRVIDHPVIGEEMCRPLPSLGGVLKIIRHHHERYDGRGYPDGLSGETIPYEVRLLSIVDAYDALTSHRAYRPAPLEHNVALETLRREAAAGKWDPVMVRELCAMLGTDGPNYPEISRPVPRLHLT